MFAAFKACDDHVGLPSLFYADTTAHTGQNKAFAVAANHTPILNWQTNLSSHSHTTRYIHITLSQKRILFIGLNS
jgi:hypothetical protein